jgi:hypothetical protein
VVAAGVVLITGKRQLTPVGGRTHTAGHP